MPGCIVVFAKPPLPGIAKTRLAAGIGEQAAASVAAALLADTVERVGRLGTRVVVATTDLSADHGVAAELWDQGAGSLGDRLERVLQRALALEPWAAAVGADAPHTPDAAWASLLSTDGAALGPTDDGGFWALRLDRCPPALLSDLPWSAPNTFSATWSRMAERGLSPRALLPSWDIDDANDLRRLVREGGGAPRTLALARGVLSC